MHTELQHNRILYNNHRRVRVTCTWKLQHQHNINKIHFWQIFLFSGYLLTYFCNILIIYFTTAVPIVTILQCVWRHGKYGCLCFLLLLSLLRSRNSILLIPEYFFNFIDNVVDSCGIIIIILKIYIRCWKCVIASYKYISVYSAYVRFYFMIWNYSDFDTYIRKVARRFSTDLFLSLGRFV